MFHHLLICRLILVLCVARIARLQSTLKTESSDYDHRSNFLLELKELVDRLGSEMRQMSQENRRQLCVTVDTNHSTSLVTEFRRQGEEIKTELKQIKDLFQPLGQQLKQKVDNDSIDLRMRPRAMCEDIVAEFRRQNDDMKTELQLVKSFLQSLTPQLELKADNFSIELAEIPLVIDGMRSEDDGDDENVVTSAISTNSTPGNPILAHTLHGTDGVMAIATLGDRLFVSRRGDSRVFVYDTTSFQLQHQLTFSGLGRYIPGLAACSTYNYMYISDYWNDRIHRIGISSAGAISTRIKWNNITPLGLSVNSACNVLVVCDSLRDRLVREYTPTGSLVREISDSNALFQAVDLNNGMWAVSRLGPIHGVVIVSVNGSTARVEHSYGNRPGSGTGQMQYPHGLTVDKHGYIIVADYENYRLLVLNPSLTDVRQLPLPLQLRYTRALVLDQSRGRLYVGEDGPSERLLVFNDVTNVGALFNV